LACTNQAELLHHLMASGQLGQGSTEHEKHDQQDLSHPEQRAGKAAWLAIVDHGCLHPALSCRSRCSARLQLDVYL